MSEDFPDGSFTTESAELPPTVDISLTICFSNQSHTSTINFKKSIPVVLLCVSSLFVLVMHFSSSLSRTSYKSAPFFDIVTVIRHAVYICSYVAGRGSGVSDLVRRIMMVFRTIL